MSIARIVALVIAAAVEVWWVPALAGERIPLVTGMRDGGRIAVGTLVNARTVGVTALALCDEAAHVMLRVTLTQNGSTGHGSSVERCTAAMERYPLRIHAHGPEGFAAGPARAELEGVVYRHGRVIDVQQWTRNITLVEGGKSAGNEE